MDTKLKPCSPRVHKGVTFRLSTTVAHMSRRLKRRAYMMGTEPASVRGLGHLCVLRVSPLSNINILETSGPITNTFYLKHHWGGRKAALGFRAGRFRTLVSMATDSSHRVIMGKRCLHLFSVVFHPILYILLCNEDMH